MMMKQNYSVLGREHSCVTVFSTFFLLLEQRSKQHTADSVLSGPSHRKSVKGITWNNKWAEETSGTRKHRVQSSDPCHHTVAPSIYCIIRRDETNQILLVHRGYSVPGEVPSVILLVQVAVLRRCSHAFHGSHLKTIQEPKVQWWMLMYF